MDKDTIPTNKNYSLSSSTKQTNDTETSSLYFASGLETISTFMIRNVPPVLFCIGVTGNILTILILSKKRNRVTCTAVFLTFLAVSDIIILLTGILTHWTWVVWNFDIRTTHEMVCKIHVVFTYYSIHFSSWILVLITCERTACVVVPHKVQLMFSRRKGLMLTTALAGILFICNSHFFYGAGISNIIWHGENSLMCMSTGPKAYEIFIQRVWTWIDLCLAFLIPCALIVTGNVLILLQLSRQLKQREELGRARQNQSSQHLTLLLHLLTIVFLVSVAPYAIFNIIMSYLLENATDVHDELEKMDYILQILTVTVALNPTLNFFLYFLSGSKFRREVKTFIFCQDGRGGSVF